MIESRQHLERKPLNEAVCFRISRARTPLPSPDLTPCSTVSELPSSALAVIYPFPLLEPLRLARLAAVSPSSMLLLVPLHAGTQCDVYSWWRGEAERFCQL